MSLIVGCPCGVEFVVPADRAGRDVKCRKCGARVHVPAPQEDSNPLAMIGFVLALVGFCFVMVTAPIGLGCSVAGLRKEANKGLAIAGTIICSLQCVLLVFFVVEIYILGNLAWMVGREVKEVVVEVKDQMKDAFAAGHTRATIKRAEQLIDKNTADIGSLPDDAQGTTLIKQRKDGWHRSLKYEVNDGELTTYTISSAGPDGEWDTRDDIDETSPTMAPDNSAEAILLMRDSRRDRKTAGLNWVCTVEPVDADRKKVLSTVVALTGDSRLGSKATEAIIRWGNDNDLKRVVRNRRLAAAAAVEILVVLNNEAKVLTYLNDPDTTARARLALTDWETNDAELVAQCHKDLRTKNRQQSALQQLMLLDIEAPVRSKIKRTLYDQLTTRGIQPDNTASAFDLLEKLGLTADDVPNMMSAYETTRNDGALAFLEQHKNAEMLAHFAKVLNRAGAVSSHAAAFLVRLGPVAESFLWPALNDTKLRQNS
jgi:hypothetical protein